MTFNCLIAGIGGQGTVLASKLIAAAAMKKGFDVRTTETIGMAQRGGSVVSHVRIGDNIYSPLIPSGKADILIAFEPAEAVRQLPFLKSDGVLITAGYSSPAMVEYLKSCVSRLAVIDNARLALKNAKTLNVALLGAAAQLSQRDQSGGFPFDAETLKEAIPEMLHERFWEINIEAFELGRKAYHEYLGQH
jgi:indolepyruvate ferredoxin oxidoreductase beta subunit